jgi:hypothetical protein
MKWISVKERLPKAERQDGTRVVLVLRQWKTSRGESMHDYELAMYAHDDEEWYDQDGIATVDQVTHWQPLPDSPEEG